MHLQRLGAGTSAYNAAISAFLRGRLWKRALWLLGKAHRMDVKPDSVMYVEAIGTCTEARRVAPAILLLDEMRRSLLQPNVVAYNAALNACSKGGVLKELMQLLGEMLAARCVPDAVTHNAAIAAFATARHWEVALQFLAEIRTCGLKHTAATCSVAIAAAGSTRAWLLALQVMDEMSRRGAQLSLAACVACGTIFGRAGCWTGTSKVLWKLCARAAGLLHDELSCVPSRSAYQDNVGLGLVAADLLRSHGGPALTAALTLQRRFTAPLLRCFWRLRGGLTARIMADDGASWPTTRELRGGFLVRPHGLSPLYLGDMIEALGVRCMLQRRAHRRSVVGVRRPMCAPRA